MSEPYLNKKYLEIFIKRLVPEWFIEKYPNYEQFIKYFLQYLDDGPDDETEGLYRLIAEYTNYFDIDYIDNLSDAELKNKLLNVFYEQYTGSKESRYLSTLVDEILFLKNQKPKFKQKGTKFCFLFFFLIILGGYFRIYNLSNENKKHNGVWNYDGSITYDGTEGAIEPFIYFVISEFYPNQYINILNILNPAGMLPVTFFQKQIIINADTGEDLLEIYQKRNNTYMAFYNNETFIGMIIPYDIQVYDQLSLDSTSYDLLLQNGTKWQLDSDVETGDGEMIFFGSIFNTNNFSGNFNRIKILHNPTPSGDYSYDYIGTETGDEGEILFDVTISSTETFEICDNTELNLIVKFN